MKLVSYGPTGHEKPGVLDASGQLHDLSSHLPAITPATFSRASLGNLRAIKPGSLPIVYGESRLGRPIPLGCKFIAMGRNYSDRAAETGVVVPRAPVVRNRAIILDAGPYDDVVLPTSSSKMDWSVELGIVIGTTAWRVSIDDALSHVAGYVVVNATSKQASDLDDGSHLGDNAHETSGILGPWLVTADEVPYPQNLKIWLDVNGRVKQRGSTRTMIFDCATLIAYVSAFTVLAPGDVVSTGTPPSTSIAHRPEAQCLESGDVLRLGIESLGEQRQRVRAV